MPGGGTTDRVKGGRSGRRHKSPNLLPIIPPTHNWPRTVDSADPESRTQATTRVEQRLRRHTSAAREKRKKPRRRERRRGAGGGIGGIEIKRKVSAERRKKFAGKRGAATETERDGERERAGTTREERPTDDWSI